MINWFEKNRFLKSSFLVTSIFYAGVLYLKLIESNDYEKIAIELIHTSERIEVLAKEEDENLIEKLKLLVMSISFLHASMDVTNGPSSRIEAKTGVNVRKRERKLKKRISEVETSMKISQPQNSSSS
jgi:uncharacterized membrane protein